MLYVHAMLYMLWYMLWYILCYILRRTHASQGFSRSSVYSPSIRDGSNSGVPPAPPARMSCPLLPPGPLPLAWPGKC